MRTPITFAVPRPCAHVCLLVAALASNPLIGQTSSVTPLQSDGVAAAPTQNQQLDLASATARLSPEDAAELRARLEEAERRLGAVTFQPDDAPSEAARAQQRERILARAQQTLGRGVTGSVSATARCADGYVNLGQHRASAADVVIVRTLRLDCDARGCRAFQVDARRESNEPFDLEVSVVCSST